MSKGYFDKKRFREIVFGDKAKSMFFARFDIRLTVTVLGQLVDRDVATVSQWISLKSKALPTMEAYFILCMVFDEDPFFCLNLLKLEKLYEKRMKSS